MMQSTKSEECTAIADVFVEIKEMRKSRVYRT